MATDKSNPSGKPQGDKRDQPIKDLNDKSVPPSKGDNVKGGAAKKGILA